MNRTGKLILLSVVFLLIAAPAAWAQSRPQGPPQARQHAEGRENVLVGRISMVEGELLRYVPAKKDWVVAVKDSPFGFEDALYSGESAKAEFLMPNSTWMRIGPNTQLQLIALKADATEVDVAVGTARFIDQSSKTVIKATTPFGYVVGEPGSAFDLYVGDESVEVIGIRGHVEFIHDADGSRYEVVPGSLSILADARQATASEGKVDAEWDDWNVARDTMWSKSLETKGESVRYLPEGIREDAGTLDNYGRWERVYYEGEYRNAWRPTQVEAGWEPYTAGRWADWYDDYCWVPSEPFGYTTHHYGYWFSANNYWYWAPPVVTIGVGAPWWGIGFSWYPGRVGWLYNDAYVGWFPLLPWEPFYAHHWWGPHSFVARYPGSIYYQADRFHYANRAVIVNQNALFTTNNFANARVVNRLEVAGNLRGAPVLANNVIPNANVNQRFNFTNTAPTARPGAVAVTQVMQNQTRIGAAGPVNGRVIQQQLATAPAGRLAAGAGVSAPRATSRLVSGAGAPGAVSARGPRELKQSARAVQSGGSRIGAAGAVGQGPGAVGGQHGTSVGRAGTAAGAARIGRGQAGAMQGSGANIGRGQGTVREGRSVNRQAGAGISQGSQRMSSGRAAGIEQGGSRTFSRDSAGRSRASIQNPGGMAREGLGKGSGHTGSGSQFRAPSAERRMGSAGPGIQHGQSGMRAPSYSRGGPGGGGNVGHGGPGGGGNVAHGGPGGGGNVGHGGPGGGGNVGHGGGPGGGGNGQHGGPGGGGNVPR